MEVLCQWECAQIHRIWSQTPYCSRSCALKGSGSSPTQPRSLEEVNWQDKMCDIELLLVSYSNSHRKVLVLNCAENNVFFLFGNEYLPKKEKTMFSEQLTKIRTFWYETESRAAVLRSCVWKCRWVSIMANDSVVTYVSTSIKSQNIKKPSPWNPWSQWLQQQLRLNRPIYAM